jgi:hypothetical protein
VGDARYTEGREAVAVFRDFWRTLPQLDDRDGPSELSRECDRVLATLKR